MWSTPAVVSLRNTVYLKIVYFTRTSEWKHTTSASFACCLAFGNFHVLFASEAGGGHWLSPLGNAVWGLKPNGLCKGNWIFLRGR